MTSLLSLRRKGVQGRNRSVQQLQNLMVFTMIMNRDILFGSVVDSSFSKELIRNKDDRNIMFLEVRQVEDGMTATDAKKLNTDNRVHQFRYADFALTM